jgi:cytochrome d ubiquinol oxidase subunit I
MLWDAVMLARIQFAFTVAFHILFPAFTIGLAAFIATLLVVWRRTGEERYRTLARFWTKVFAVSFAMGVVSGIVLSYQFGTNWSRFSVVVGNVIGPAIAYEVLTAFFLEATFLGILLFGWNRFPPALHVTAAIMVAIGTAMSAFWILSANSWMHAPAGHVVRDGIAYPVDWLQIIFNPTFPYRLAHTLAAAYLTTATVVLAVGARYVLENRPHGHGATMLRFGLGMVIVLAPLQVVLGDKHGLSTLEHQPAKIAAMEAHWDGARPVDLVLFAIPNERTESNDYSVAIPHAGSLILTHSWNGLIRGLKDFPVSERPPVAPVFYAFRVMVGIGLLLVLVALVGGVLWARGRLFEARWFLRPVSLIWPLPFVATIAGWIVTEVGRQPWIATGILRTADAASPVSVEKVATSLALFVIVYSVVFTVGIVYIRRLIDKGPQEPTGSTVEGVPNRPITGATGAPSGPTPQPGPAPAE